MKSLSKLLFIVFALSAKLAHAQLSVEIGGAGAQQIPLALYSFAGENADELFAIAKNDLTRTGLFKLFESPSKPTDTQTPPIAELRKSGADTVAWGAVYKAADGKIEIKLKIQDTVRNVPVDASSILVANNPRTAGHALANRIYEKLIGKRGFFNSKLAYITQHSRESYELRVADWDGQNAATALRSREPIISPAFSPDGEKLAYVSFESGKANIVYHVLNTGQRQVLANYRGTNSAPAFSPDGKWLAAALSRDGLAQIYLLSIDGTQVKRLTTSSGIDTEPAFNHDGQRIYFVSDRGGQPQIYSISTNGGAVQRVTFKGEYNVSPTLSADGNYLSFISRREGRFMTVVMDLTTQQETIVSDTSTDESPTFTSNGQFVMYATKSKGKGVLVLASIDGKIRNTLSMSSADIREPALSK